MRPKTYRVLDRSSEIKEEIGSCTFAVNALRLADGVAAGVADVAAAGHLSHAVAALVAYGAVALNLTHFVSAAVAHGAVVFNLANGVAA